MDISRPLLADAAFPDESLVFSSRDFDAVRAGVARIFKPHLLRLHGTGVNLQARMHHLRQGNASVNRLEYGAEVEIDPNRLDDFFLVQIPVAGHASIACGNRRFDSTPQAASLVSPTLPLHMRWHAGNAQVCVRFERAMVEQHCAAHLGHALDEPLEFEPELKLDTPAGQYFLRLVKLFAEELTFARLDGCAHPLANAHVAEHFASTLLNALLYGQKSNISEALARPDGRRAAFRAAGGRLYPAPSRGAAHHRNARRRCRRQYANLVCRLSRFSPRLADDIPEIVQVGQSARGFAERGGRRRVRRHQGRA